MKSYTLILLLFAIYLSTAQTWQTIDTLNSKYSKVFFLNENIGFVSNYQGYKKTTDGGQTWTYVAHEVDAYGRGEIHFISPDTGFRSGAKTHDGGSTWQYVPNFAGPFCFVESNQYAFAAPYMPFGNTFPSMRSSDFGETWAIKGTVTPNPNSSGSGIYDIDFADSLHGVVGSGGGNIFYTEDGAQTWSTRTLSGWEADVSAVDMLNENVAFAASELPPPPFGPWQSKIYKSVNGGDVWSHISSVYGQVEKMQFLNDSVGFLCNTYSLYKTVNGGVNWTVDTSLYGVVDFHLIDETKMYLLTWDSVLTNGGVFKRDITDNIGVIREDLRISIYPNPTSGIVKLNTEEPALVGKEYVITDLVGREVYKGILGSEKLQIDLSNVAKGSYYLRMGSASKHLVIK